jgi:hypothetical protein
VPSAIRIGLFLRPVAILRRIRGPAVTGAGRARAPRGARGKALDLCAVEPAVVVRVAASDQPLQRIRQLLLTDFPVASPVDSHDRGDEVGWRAVSSRTMRGRKGRERKGRRWAELAAAELSIAVLVEFP